MGFQWLNENIIIKKWPHTKETKGFLGQTGYLLGIEPFYIYILYILYFTLVKKPSHILFSIFKEGIVIYNNSAGPNLLNIHNKFLVRYKKPPNQLCS